MDCSRSLGLASGPAAHHNGARPEVLGGAAAIGHVLHAINLAQSGVPGEALGVCTEA